MVPFIYCSSSEDTRTNPPKGYSVKELSPGVFIVNGPDFLQTWQTKQECLDAAWDHFEDGTIVSLHDMV